MSPFCGATNTPVLDFWWRLLWVSKPEWAVLFTLGRGICVTHSLRFISGMTPANLLVASMVVEPSLPHTCHTLVGLETRSYHAAAHSVRSGRPDALPTELSRLGHHFWGLDEAVRHRQLFNLTQAPPVCSCVVANKLVRNGELGAHSSVKYVKIHRKKIYQFHRLSLIFRK